LTLIWLLRPTKPKPPLLQRPEVEQDVVHLPCRHTHEETGDGIQDVLIKRKAVQ
jgi:hypothetical protein